ncbi:RraA family protein [Hydrogenophaga sp. BPS33]|uniref:RraA family protein n=1 Tax=Hydrogenophaga sp. BPS33 TaxID=2651974 RepID=UPI00131FFA94|nr:RraA family protein [Hydrogenophaga sp. BPS33]QHE84083.1 RraA family protein [Hydrogenophaga sp. BPS33]
MYTINDMPLPLDPRIVEALGQVETATVGHWRLMGFVDPTIQSILRPARRVVGTAVTVAIPSSDSTLLHHAVGLVRPGDFLVIDRLGDDRHACWGGGVTVAAKAAGAAGAVVDGPCTDTEEIEASSFPLWARGVSPITTRLHDLGGGLNVPVSCGGVAVMPGDVVLADASGVLVLPRNEALLIAERALAIQRRSVDREAAIARGAKLGELSGASSKVLARA